MLSADEIESYHVDGYVIPDFRLENSVLDDIRANHDRLLARHPEFSDYCPAVLAFDTGFLNIARMPAILDMVEQLELQSFAILVLDSVDREMPLVVADALLTCTSTCPGELNSPRLGVHAKRSGRTE